MDKAKLIEAICEQLKKDLLVAKAAALETYAAATGEESQPENEYDTRALEASYLAGAQAKRVREIEDALTMYKFLQVKKFTDKTPIGSTALVELELEGKKSTVFLVAAGGGGGLSITFAGKNIQVLTPKSPLGEALLGLKTGDVALVEKADDTLEYEILSVS